MSLILLVVNWFFRDDYLYAAECVLQRGTPFFDDIRGGNLSAEM
jgi:hypothetical protein